MTGSSPVDLRSIAAESGEIGRFPVIDFDHLWTFTDGDNDLEAELADLYMNTARGYVSGMRAALTDERAWSAEAHGLKGASSNLGACRVAALAKEAEFEAPSEARLEALRSAVEDVAALFNARRA